TFIVDSGAQASVLFNDAAKRLGLTPEGNVAIHGASGDGSSGWVLVHEFRSGVFVRQDERMVVIPNNPGTDADGVLGMNAFVSSRVEWNIAGRQLRLGASGKTPAGYIAQIGKVRQGSFFVVIVSVDGVPVKAVIDSGARRTTGNLQLLAALGFKDGDARLHPAESVQGATTQSIAARSTRLRSLGIGKHVFSMPMVTFADLPVFHPLDLDDGPALIIGIDLLSTLQAFAIDYPREELQLRP
ncbi:MAG: retropepsin-like aspartic protease, partial [Luteimonas sp.]